MSIPNILAKIKGLMLNDRAFVGILLILAFGLGFGLGRLSVTSEAVSRTTKKEALQPSMIVSAVPFASTSSVSGVSTETSTGTGAYVGSRKGDKYHLPWCQGALRITEANKIWFKDKEAAEKAGYAPAANCPGI